MVCGYTFILLFWVFTFAASTTTVSSNTGRLRCRVCHNARDLSECTAETYCSQNEDCFMEQTITEQLEVVFNGGCRASDVCQQGASGIVGRRDVTVACSRCCGGSNICNVHLCGISNPAINATQCYSCDWHPTAQQTSCLTFQTCLSDEMCYSRANTIAGRPENTNGCMKKMICGLLMREVFRDMDACYHNTDMALCGVGEVSSLCDVCCGYGGCNYGDCHDIKERMYLLYKNGKLDMTTLTLIP